MNNENNSILFPISYPPLYEVFLLNQDINKNIINIVEINLPDGLDLDSFLSLPLVEKFSKFNEVEFNEMLSNLLSPDLHLEPKKGVDLFYSLTKLNGNTNKNEKNIFNEYEVPESVFSRRNKHRINSNKESEEENLSPELHSSQIMKRKNCTTEN